MSSHWQIGGTSPLTPAAVAVHSAPATKSLEVPSERHGSWLVAGSGPQEWTLIGPIGAGTECGIDFEGFNWIEVDG